MNTELGRIDHRCNTCTWDHIGTVVYVNPPFLISSSPPSLGTKSIRCSTSTPVPRLFLPLWGPFLFDGLLRLIPVVPSARRRIYCIMPTDSYSNCRLSGCSLVEEKTLSDHEFLFQRSRTDIGERKEGCRRDY